MRFQIAQKIAKALGAFHADGWVHKSFRSQSIVFFCPTGDSQGNVDFSNPYLSNFEYSRQEAVQSTLTWEDKIENNVYRHPDRQGPPDFSFSKVHDVYALGVVLLEIGIWQSAMSVYKEAHKEVERKRPNFRAPPRFIQKTLIAAADRIASMVAAFAA